MIKLAISLKKFHDRSLIHCDLKPENIFMLDFYTPVLADLGEALPENEKRTYKSGTDFYLAPEIY